MMDTKGCDVQASFIAWQPQSGHAEMSRSHARRPSTHQPVSLLKVLVPLARIPSLSDENKLMNNDGIGAFHPDRQSPLSRVATAGAFGDVQTQEGGTHAEADSNTFSRQNKGRQSPAVLEENGRKKIADFVIRFSEASATDIIHFLLNPILFRAKYCTEAAHPLVAAINLAQSAAVPLPRSWPDRSVHRRNCGTVQVLLYRTL
jgi:hypothetical protein